MPRASHRVGEDQLFGRSGDDGVGVAGQRAQERDRVEFAVDLLGHNRIRAIVGPDRRLRPHRDMSHRCVEGSRDGHGANSHLTCTYQSSS